MHAAGVLTCVVKSASKPSPMAHTSQPQREKLLEAEVARLREQMKPANMEKNEINSEYEKLSTICRSQRQLHGIKQALASSTPSKSQSSPGIQQQQEVLMNKSCSSPDENSWQAFPEDLKKPTTLLTSVITRNNHQNKSSVTVPVTNMNQSRCSSGGSRNNLTSQPPEWAAF